jgi:hypothetical protein
MLMTLCTTTVSRHQSTVAHDIATNHLFTFNFEDVRRTRHWTPASCACQPNGEELLARQSIFSHSRIFSKLAKPFRLPSAENERLATFNFLIVYSHQQLHITCRHCR